MGERLERVLSTILVASTALIAVAFAKREFFDNQESNATNLPPVEFLSDWQRMISYGTVIGDPNAKIKIVEFADLQCPFCQAFQHRVNTVRQRYGNQVSQVFIHYPIQGHRFALPAAKSAECARTFDRFGQFVDLAYSKQDSFGIKSWTSYASDAGIADTAAFSRCFSSQDLPTMVDRGRQLASSIQVQGTPTVIINGWRFAAPPQDSVLEQTIASLLVGRRPPAAGKRWFLF